MGVATTQILGTTTTIANATSSIPGALDVPVNSMCVALVLVAGIDQSGNAVMLNLQFGAKNIGAGNVVVGSSFTTICNDTGLSSAKTQAVVNAVTGHIDITVTGVPGSNLTWEASGTAYILDSTAAG